MDRCTEDGCLRNDNSCENLTLPYLVLDICNRFIISLDTLRPNRSEHLPLTRIILISMKAILLNVIGTIFTEERRNPFQGTHQSRVEILCQFIVSSMLIMRATLSLIILKLVF